MYTVYGQQLQICNTVNYNMLFIIFCNYKSKESGTRLPNWQACCILQNVIKY